MSFLWYCPTDFVPPSFNPKLSLLTRSVTLNSKTWSDETVLICLRKRSPVMIGSVRLYNLPKNAKSVPPSMVWATNMVFVLITPVIFVYGMALALLAETVPFLMRNFFTTFEVTLLSVSLHYGKVCREGHHNCSKAQSAGVMLCWTPILLTCALCMLHNSGTISWCLIHVSLSLVSFY